MRYFIVVLNDKKARIFEHKIIRLIFVLTEMDQNTSFGI